jgi:hypothetical protein
MAAPNARPSRLDDQLSRPHALISPSAMNLNSVSLSFTEHGQALLKPIRPAPHPTSADLNRTARLAPRGTRVGGHFSLPMR